jgi:hyperosmotically inducible protein
MHAGLRRTLAHFRLFTILLTFAACGGCFNPFTAPLHNVPNDGAISAEVEAKLKADRLEDLSGILVSTEAGTVTLVGSVQRPEQKARAAELTRQIKGVKRVKNDIEIRSDLFQ